MTGRTHLVAVLALPDVLVLDFAIPVQAFHISPMYRVEVCGTGSVADASGAMTISPASGLDVVDAADTVVVPGYAHPTRRPPETAVQALRRAHERGARIASICTGAFALGYAGLLVGQQATTHWSYLDRFAREFPGTEVQRDVLYVDNGALLTSAGVASGIDLCLHMIRRDHGSAVANHRARLLVAAPHRSGDQRQFVAQFVPTTNGSSLASTREWAMERLDQNLTLADLASHAAISARTLARRFAAETGLTPVQWLALARIDKAREILETTDATMDTVARRAGFGTSANFRRLFKRHVGVSPKDYRHQYAH